MLLTHRHFKRSLCTIAVAAIVGLVIGAIQAQQPGNESKGAANSTKSASKSAKQASPSAARTSKAAAAAGSLQSAGMGPPAADPAAAAPGAVPGSGRGFRYGEGLLPGERGPTTPIGPGLQAAPQSISFRLREADGSSAEQTATRAYAYQLVAGAAKPRRQLSAPYGMGMAMGGMNGGATAETVILPNIYAYIFDGTAAEDASDTELSTEPTRVEIKVVVPYSGQNEESNGTAIGAPMGSMMGGMMGGMPSGGYGGMGGYDGNMMGYLPTAEMIALEKAKELSSGSGSNEAAAVKLSADERSNIAQLIRLDIWIEDARALLRSSSSEADRFKATEEHLRALLTEEYDAQLLKQRGDVARLSEKLKRLQEELERRAQAKDRVVEVQLGKLVLEAQGLISNER